LSGAARGADQKRAWWLSAYRSAGGSQSARPPAGRCW
jgi:hypothetical protein